jgi:hypothetical protein
MAGPRDRACGAPRGQGFVLAIHANIFQVRSWMVPRLCTPAALRADRGGGQKDIRYIAPRPPRLRVNPISRESISEMGVDSGAMRASIESHRDFSAFAFQPVFPCSPRSPTGIAHAARVPTEAGSRRFFRDGGDQASRTVFHLHRRSSPDRRQHRSRRGNSRARGSPRAGRQSGHACPPWIVGIIFFGSSVAA